jgi:hypothetical protein
VTLRRNGSAAAYPAEPTVPTDITAKPFKTWRRESKLTSWLTGRTSLARRYLFRTTLVLVCLSKNGAKIWAAVEAWIFL